MVSLRVPAWMIGILSLVVTVGCTEKDGPSSSPSAPDAEDLPFNPRTYVVPRPSTPIEVDGRLDEDSWTAAPWTADFVDIRGPDAPTPRFRTRAKMLWDDEALYVTARLEEPDVWARLTRRDTVVFYDNDFEVFIDPTGTTHNYYELEVNARETVWDLMLLKPYRDGGPALDAWDIRGLDVGVNVEGTLNDPSDADEGWTVEMALPWDVLEEAAPEERPPRAGEQWRLNFSRVQWPTTVVDGRYQKDVDTSTAHPEDNWVWSPQGAIDMHRPERWGVVQFSDAEAGAGPDSVDATPNRTVAWALRRLYYRQRAYRDENSHYAASLSSLNAHEIVLDDRAFDPTLRTTQTMYEITAPGENGTTVHIRHDGKVWTTEE